MLVRCVVPVEPAEQHLAQLGVFHRVVADVAAPPERARALLPFLGPDAVADVVEVVQLDSGGCHRPYLRVQSTQTHWPYSIFQ